MKRTLAVGAAAALVAWNNGVLPALRLSSRGRATAGTSVALGAAGLAVATGTSRGELGFGHARAGTLWGSAAAAVPLAGYVVAWVTPSLHARVTVPEQVRHDFVEWVGAHIPFGTVVTEELLFRGVLTALTERAFTPTTARAVRAAAFGLWHVHPAHVAGDSVPAAIAVTAASSLVFDHVRARSGSLLAPALLHLVLNVGGAVVLRRIQVTAGAREVPLPPV